MDQYRTAALSNPMAEKLRALGSWKSNLLDRNGVSCWRGLCEYQVACLDNRQEYPASTLVIPGLSTTEVAGLQQRLYGSRVNLER